MIALGSIVSIYRDGIVDTGSVLAVMFGGAPTPPAAVEALADAFPSAVLLNGYGLTEGGASICVLPPGEARHRPGSVGKPMPGAEVRVVDDEGTPLATGAVGEIVLKVPTGERQYWGDEDASARTWREGSGNARRSTLPLEVRGMASSGTHPVGSM